jgi:hypothetical protein
LLSGAASALLVAAMLVVAVRAAPLLEGSEIAAADTPKLRHGGRRLLQPFRLGLGLATRVTSSAGRAREANINDLLNGQVRNVDCAARRSHFCTTPPSVMHACMPARTQNRP